MIDYKAIKVESNITWGIFNLISDLWLRLQNKYWMHTFRAVSIWHNILALKETLGQCYEIMLVGWISRWNSVEEERK